MQLAAIRFIQQFSTPGLDWFFTNVTRLGEKTILVVILTLVYWCIDKEKGRMAGLSTFTAIALCNGLKGVFMVPRPIGEPGIRSLRTHTAGGYSFPSGHTQGATATYFALIDRTRRSHYVIAGALSFLVALSRVYMGVHYPLDVAVGLVLGLLIALGYTYVHENINSLLFLYGAVALVLSLFFLLPSPYSPSEDFYAAFGGYLGFALGALFEGRYADFKTKGNGLRKAVRWLLGLAALYGLEWGLDIVLPMAVPAGAGRLMLESGLISFFLMGLYPLIFKKIRL